jgi:hypothetical protein
MMPEGPENNAGGADKLLDGTPERALTRGVTLEDPQRQPPATDRPMRTFIHQLETTEAIAAVVQRACRRLGLRSAADRARVEEDLKLQHYFGGSDVAYLSTPEGRVVVAAGVLGTDEFRKALLSLSLEERQQVTVYSPDPWNGWSSLAPTPFSDEGERPPYSRT